MGKNNTIKIESKKNLEDFRFTVQGSRFTIQGFGYRVPRSVFRVPRSRFTVQGSRFTIQGFEYRVPCSVYRVPCSAFRVPCSAFRVPRSVLRVPCSVFRVQGFRFHSEIKVMVSFVFERNSNIMVLCKPWVRVKGGMNPVLKAREESNCVVAQNFLILTAETANFFPEIIEHISIPYPPSIPNHLGTE